MFQANHLSGKDKIGASVAHPSGLGSLAVLLYQEQVSKGQGRAEERPKQAMTSGSHRRPGPEPEALGSVPALASSCLRLLAGVLPGLGLQSRFTQQYLFQEKTDGTSSVVQWWSPLATAGGTGSTPGPGRSHMLRDD